jgi:hypothetical protein
VNLIPQINLSPRYNPSANHSEMALCDAVRAEEGYMTGSFVQVT